MENLNSASMRECLVASGHQEKPNQAEPTEGSGAGQIKKGQWGRQRKWPEHKIVGTLVCERCGLEYPAKKYQIRRKQRFCSGECRNPETPEQRFWKYVHKTESCWLWTGSKVSGRCGNCSAFSSGELAHRVSWRLHKGPIPEGLYVCHKCDNGFCVNPDHMFLGTQKDNMDDMISKGRGSWQ